MLGVYSLILFFLNNAYGSQSSTTTIPTTTTSTAKPGGIYRLPDLQIHTNRSYLLKGEETTLECRVHRPNTGGIGQTSWSNVTLDRVIWLKDGSPVEEALSSRTAPEAYRFSNSSAYLTLLLSNYLAEGDYQCSAIVRNIPLPISAAGGANRPIDTRLVSAPIKLRRARITKFERYAMETVRVRQGQVARLPCLGLPDVVPGPPEVWFEKHGHEGVPLGRTGNERFIATASGLQVALAQPSDSGRYYCVARNYFTKQTRKAPKYIVLLVEPIPTTHSTASISMLPTPIWPVPIPNDTMIEYHVVQGQPALLECVAWNAKVVWNKPDLSMPAVSLTDDKSRIRQIWGNLRFKQVLLEDAGEYICHALDPTTSGVGRVLDLSKRDHPRVRYQLVVHAPTSVRLGLAQQVQDKSWQLSCYASNLRYEIPMVYVNGLPLIDAMEEMGVAPQTNFYTNPINVTLRASNPLSGSIQCISRPAMEEAEVYGQGLERGKAMNLYVDERLNVKPELIGKRPKGVETEEGAVVQMQCEPHEELKGSVKVKWIKDNRELKFLSSKYQLLNGHNLIITYVSSDEDSGVYTCEMTHMNGQDQQSASGILTVRPRPTPTTITTTTTIETSTTAVEPLRILKPTVFKSGSDGSIRIQWGVRPSGRIQLGEFQIEARRREISLDDLTKHNSWKPIDTAPGHVRAMTLKKSDRLQPGYEYQFRIATHFDRSTHHSEASDWIPVEGSLKSTEDLAPIIPLPPEIIRLQPISHDSILVGWRHSAPNNQSNGRATKFIVHYGPPNPDAGLWFQPEWRHVEVSANAVEMLLTELDPDTEYRVELVAENGAGKSRASKPRITRTYDLPDDNTGDAKSPSWWTRFRHNFLPRDLSVKLILLALALLVASVLLILLCCLTLCRLRELHQRRRNQYQGRHRHSRRRNSSMDSSKEGDMFGSPQSHSSTHRLGGGGTLAVGKGIYHEPCFFASGDPLADLSPLSVVDGLLPPGVNVPLLPGNGTLRRAQLPKAAAAQGYSNPKAEAVEEDIYTSRLQLASERHGSVGQRPNLYYGSDDSEVKERTIQPGKIYINPMGTLKRSGQADRALKRVDSMRSAVSATNGAVYGRLSIKPAINPESHLRPRHHSPTPSTLSAYTTHREEMREMRLGQPYQPSRKKPSTATATPSHVYDGACKDSGIGGGGSTSLNSSSRSPASSSSRTSSVANGHHHCPAIGVGSDEETPPSMPVILHSSLMRPHPPIVHCLPPPARYCSSSSISSAVKPFSTFTTSYSPPMLDENGLVGGDGQSYGTMSRSLTKALGATGSGYLTTFGDR